MLLHVLHVPCDRSPSQYVKLSLIWPVIRVRNVAMTNGIAANIFPFVTVAFAAEGRASARPALQIGDRQKHVPPRNVSSKHDMAHSCWPMRIHCDALRDLHG